MTTSSIQARLAGFTDEQIRAEFGRRGLFSPETTVRDLGNLAEDAGVKLANLLDVYMDWWNEQRALAN